MRPPTRRMVAVKIQLEKVAALKRRWMKKKTHSHKQVSAVIFLGTEEYKVTEECTLVSCSALSFSGEKVGNLKKKAVQSKM
jgi:hypothetical protein